MTNEIFLRYLTIVGSVLVTAGAILVFMTLVLRRNVGSVWATYRGWLMMVPIVMR